MKKTSISMRCATPALAMAFLAFSAVAADPNTWWVDDAYYGAEVQDGSEMHPFGTILAAVTNAACANGDTIKVRPGIYDKDYYEVTYTPTTSTEFQPRCRVWIDKNVNIVATGSKEETHIVGRLCPVEEGGHATFHTGTTSIRCVTVDKGGLGSTLTGFTLRDGSTINYTGAVGRYSAGGAVGVYNSKDFYVTDCVISNCSARHSGGAAYGGTFNRCFIYDCLSYAGGAAFYDSIAINSVIASCRLSSGTASHNTVCTPSTSKLINCTIYGCKPSRVATDNCFNCIFLGNGGVETNGIPLDASNIYASDGREYRNAEPFQLFAPALCDYHLLPNSDAIGVGDPSHLSTITLPAGTEIRDMDGNLIDLTAENINAGAYQTPKTPQYGGVQLSGDVSVNGFPTYGTNLFYASSWPMSVKVGTGSAHYRFGVSGEKTDDLIFRYSGKDGYVAITPPYSAGAIQTNNCTKPSIVTRYVDGVNGSDDNDGKTAAKAYKTIQKVIDASTSAGDARLVYVAEGEYDTGGGVARGVTNRVNIPALRYFKFVATGDRDKTIIRGAAAKDERDPVNHPGCGPDAVRCVSYVGSGTQYSHTVAFIGFTFADGHTDCDQNSSYDVGGAGFGRSTDGKSDCLQFIDCVFTNCYAPAGGIAQYAHFTRCRFIDCGGGAEGFRYSILNSCVVEKGNFGTGVLGTQTRAVNCSVADSNASDGSAGQILINCALGDGGTLPTSAVTWGSTANSCFADAENGDLRFVSGSPALDAARRVFPVPGDADWSSFTKYFTDFSSDNIDGSPWVWYGGFPVAGAYVGWVPGLSLALDAANYSITGGSAGGNLLDPGDTATIARSPSAVRHYGIVVDGVTNMLDSGAYVYTMPAEVGMGGVAIEGVLDQNWYVNPDPESGASDANNGFTPNTAKQTLAGVLSVATNVGDVVNAYPGTYGSGEMRFNPDDPIATRAIIPEKVTLKAVGRAEDTVILGESAPEQGRQGNYGQGTNAVRCVAIRPNAVLDGFTLTGGRTLSNTNVQLHCSGGAVYASGSSSTSLVKDCIISNNVAAYGGGGYYGRYLNCRVFDNRATHNGDGGAFYRGGPLQGCVIDRNYGTYTVMYVEPVYGCTIGYNNGNRGVYYYQPKAEAYKVFNSVIYRYGNNQSIFWNCAMCNDSATISEANLVHGTFTTNFAALKLDENFRPAADSPLVDMGDDEKRGDLFPEKDVYGVPRVLNDGRFDIGACEYDWRKSYSATLGQAVDVKDVTSNVVEVADAVRVPEGSLSLDWRSPADVTGTFTASVTGEGTLTVLLGGVDFATLTAADGRKTLTTVGIGAEQRFDFVYSGDGYAELSDFVRNAGFRMILR